MSKENNKRFIFPKWSNKVPAMIAISVIGIVTFVVYLFWYWFAPSHLEIGYQPEQPIPYSHLLHAGSGLLEAGRALLCAAREVLVGLGYLAGALEHQPGTAPHVAHDAAQPGGHAMQSSFQLSDLILTITAGCLCVEPPFGDRAANPRGTFKGRADASAQPEGARGEESGY